MATIFPGRFTAQTDGPFVVFLIGMRVNRLLAPQKWMPVMRAMGPMLRELYRHPELGFLSAEMALIWRGVLLVQYWRSFEQLEAFARDRNQPHLPAWQAFNQAVGGDGSVGIFHETYVIAPGNSETVYGNMPRFGLAAATSHVPAIGRRETARKRLEIDSQLAQGATPATATNTPEAQL